MVKVRFSITNVIDHNSVCVDSFKITSPAAVVADEVAQLCNDFIVIWKGRSDLSPEVDLWFARVAEPLAPLGQKDSINVSPALVLKGGYELTVKRWYVSEKHPDFFIGSHTPCSKVKLWFRLRVTHHGRDLSAYLGRQNRPRFSALRELHPANSLYAEIFWYRIYVLVDVSQHCSLRYE